MKVGDTIQCHDLVDYDQTHDELLQNGIITKCIDYASYKLEVITILDKTLEELG